MSNQTIDFRAAFLTSVAIAAPATGASFEDAVDVWDNGTLVWDDTEGHSEVDFLSPAECDQRAGYHYPQN